MYTQNLTNMFKNILRTLEAEICSIFKNYEDSASVPKVDILVGVLVLELLLKRRNNTLKVTRALITSAQII